MSHLDAEFKKQSIPSLKSLIADQVGFIFTFIKYDAHPLLDSLKASKSTEQYVIIVRIDPSGLRISCKLRSILR